MPATLRSLVGSLLGSVISGRMTRSADPLDFIPRHHIHGSERWDAAESLEREARLRSPPDSMQWLSCAAAWFELDQLDRAAASLETSLALDPRNHHALDGLGTVYKSMGELERAIGFYRHALEIAPTNRGAFQNLLFAMLCSGSCSDLEILESHRRFAQTFERALAGHPRPWQGVRDPARRLRIGYVSADLRDHVTGRCMAPVLANHDARAFDVFCYYDGRRADDFTRALQASCGTWRNMASLDDDQLCAQVREDRIDILVDLSGHTPGNRILVFARKAAPVQVSYLDYSATTGLDAIDYRLTTEACDPTGRAEPFYTESLHRLPHTYWAYNPPEVADIAPPGRAAAGGGLLLACLNSFYRVSDAALRIWGEILRKLPDARLALIGVASDDATRNAIRRRLVEAGVDEARVELFGALNYGHYIQLVRATDIALAPFPYNGAMTTFDCLWNGVPVVCLRGGATFRSNMGSCILGLVRMHDLVVPDADAYVKAVLGLAADGERRNTLRQTLRDRVRSSPICDGAALAREIEAAYRHMWARFCEAGTN